MHDAGVVEVADGADDDLDELGRVVLVVGPLGADAVKELAAGAEVRHEVHCARVECQARAVAGVGQTTCGCSGSVRKAGRSAI